MDTQRDGVVVPTALSALALVGLWTSGGRGRRARPAPGILGLAPPAPSPRRSVTTALDMPSGASLPSSAWRVEWSRVLAERDHVSCQQSGPHGPPFAPGLKAERALLRWLPWNWGSIDGTGWCYDVSWDEMRPCEEMEGSVDWNGVGNVPGDEPNLFQPGLPPALLLVVASVGIATAAHAAYSEWARRRARRAADEDMPHPSKPIAFASGVFEWLRSGRAAPWRWEPTALHTLAGGAVGLAIALLLPLPQGGLPAWASLDADSALDEG